MNNALREYLTLSFSNEGLDRGAVEEVFYPWDLTIMNWQKEGLETDIFDKKLTQPGIPTELGYVYKDRPILQANRYYNDMHTEALYELEKQLGLDPIKRMAFRVPFISYEEKILEETDDYIIRYDRDGWTRKYMKNSELVQIIKPVVTDEESWERHKEHTLEALKKYCTDENMERFYGPYREGNQKGEFAIRFRLQGFFWCPRDLMGIEEHLFGYYDHPEMLKDMAQFILDIYKDQMDKILKIIKPDVLFFEEDLSGKDGPMLSPDCFDEFVAPYYREIVPFLKERGVKHIFVDTDGDFTKLIPNFMRVGVDGFLPVDVNAGVDIVKVREQYPTLKFIGGFDKLKIIEGPEAIDREFERLLPVIRQGGYLPGTDHQPAPSTPFKHYQYYVKRLREVMTQYRGQNVLK